jgi:hypothetical protein
MIPFKLHQVPYQKLNLQTVKYWWLERHFQNNWLHNFYLNEYYQYWINVTKLWGEIEPFILSN